MYIFMLVYLILSQLHSYPVISNELGPWMTLDLANIIDVLVYIHVHTNNGIICFWSV